MKEIFNFAFVLAVTLPLPILFVVWVIQSKFWRRFKGTTAAGVGEALMGLVSLPFLLAQGLFQVVCFLGLIAVGVLIPLTFLGCLLYAFFGEPTGSLFIIIH